MTFPGTDIVSVSRLAAIISQRGDAFLSRVFSESEQAFCRAKAQSDQHFAGRFAAKEAVKKTFLASNMVQVLSLKNIVISAREDGAPIVEILDKQLKNQNFQLRVSISHSDEFATAMAILETDDVQ